MSATNQVKTLLHGFLLCLLIAISASPQTFEVGWKTDGTLRNTNPSIVLALSGGGARGIASIGILKAFEERGVAISAIAGTSIGGVIGGLYACGYTPSQIEQIFKDIDWGEIFGNRPDRRAMFLTQRQDRDRHLISVRFLDFKPTVPQGITGGQKLISLLTTLTLSANYRCGGDFDKLTVPYRTVSTDVVSGELIVIDSGSIADAMRATIAFPLAFTGLESDGRLLMDGGMLMPIPVYIARSMADSHSIVVAINTSSPLQSLSDLETPVHIANQVTTIMTADKMAAQLRCADIVLTPEIDTFASTDFDKMDSLIASGHRYGLVMCDSVLTLIAANEKNRVVTFDAVVCEDSKHDSLAQRLVGSLVGRPVSLTAVESTLESLRQETKSQRISASILVEDSNSLVRRILRVAIAPTLSCKDWNLRFNGMTILDSAVVARTLPACEGIVDAKWLDTVCRHIESEYRNLGWDMVSAIVARVDSSSNEIQILIDEAIIKRIDVANTVRTREWLVRSLFAQKPGQPISSKLLSRGLTNIAGTDYFDRVSVHLTHLDKNPGGAIVEFDVDEKPHTQMRLGWHWNDDYQSEEFLEILDDNIEGIGLFGIVHGQYASDRQSAYGLTRMDRILASLLTATVKVGYSRMERRFYSFDGQNMSPRIEDRFSVECSLGRQIMRLGTVSAKLTGERVSLDSATHGKEILQIRKLSLVSQVENFDRLPFPIVGKQHLFALESAGKVLGGNTEYTRFKTSIEAYFPLTESINYHPLFAVAFSRSNLPLSEKLYIGGMSEFMGYRGFELVGDKLVQSSHELRSKLTSRLYFALRYDIGNLYAEADQISVESLRHGIGAWLAVETPIGPIVGGWGKASHTGDHAYLNVGFTF